MFSIALTIVVTNEKGVDSSYPTRKQCVHTCPENRFGPTLLADKDLWLIFNDVGMVLCKLTQNKVILKDK